MFFCFIRTIQSLPFPDCHWITSDELNLNGYKINKNTDYCFNGSYFISGEKLSIKAAFWMSSQNDWNITEPQTDAFGVLGALSSDYDPIGCFSSTQSQTIYAFMLLPSYSRTEYYESATARVTTTTQVANLESGYFEIDLSGHFSCTKYQGASGYVHRNRFIIANPNKASITLRGTSSDNYIKVITPQRTFNCTEETEISDQTIILMFDYEYKISGNTKCSFFAMDYDISAMSQMTINNPKSKLPGFTMKLGSDNALLTKENTEYNESTFSGSDGLSGGAIAGIVIAVIIVVAVAVCVLLYFFVFNRHIPCLDKYKEIK